MARTTPEETFDEAKAAMKRGDWEGFFACLAPGDVAKIAENSVAIFIGDGETVDPAFARLCTEHAVPEQTLLAVRTLLKRMAASAERSISLASSSDPAATLQQSRSHKQIVDEHRAALKKMLTAVPDLPRFTAALERAMRAAVGGGSVSSALFVDETLTDVSVAEDKAWATRLSADGDTEDIGFVRRKGMWYIRLFAQRPRSRRG